MGTGVWPGLAAASPAPLLNGGPTLLRCRRRVAPAALAVRTRLARRLLSTSTPCPPLCVFACAPSTSKLCYATERVSPASPTSISPCWQSELWQPQVSHTPCNSLASCHKFMHQSSQFLKPRTFSWKPSKPWYVLENTPLIPYQCPLQDLEQLYVDSHPQCCQMHSVHRAALFMLNSVSFNVIQWFPRRCPKWPHSTTLVLPLDNICVL